MTTSLSLLVLTRCAQVACSATTQFFSIVFLPTFEIVFSFVSFLERETSDGEIVDPSIPNRNRLALFNSQERQFQNDTQLLSTLDWSVETHTWNLLVTFCTVAIVLFRCRVLSIFSSCPRCCVQRLIWYLVSFDCWIHQLLSSCPSSPPSRPLFVNQPVVVAVCRVWLYIAKIISIFFFQAK